MSIDREYMPKVIGNGPTGFVSSRLPQIDVDPDFFAPPAQISPPPAMTRSEAIKDWLKVLTHREMVSFVKEIFDAHATLFPSAESSVLARAITMAQLPDVLDKVAYGD